MKELYPYIITGYKGFVGGNLAKSYSNTILWDKDDEYDENSIRDCKGIFHIGGCADLREPDINNMFYYNFERSRQLFSLAKKWNKRVVFASSSAIYGNGLGPTNSYSWSKVCTEELGVEMLGDKFTSLRFFNVYGLGEEHKGLMSSIPYQIYNSDSFGIFPVTGYTDISPRRDFVWVEDVIKALKLSMNNRIDRVYDVGTGNPTPYSKICEIMDTPYYYTNSSEKPIGYQDYTCANMDKFLPGWDVTKPIDGIRNYKEQMDERTKVLTNSK